VTVWVEPARDVSAGAPVSRDLPEQAESTRRKITARLFRIVDKVFPFP
jgi:hypothetical protein